MPLFPLHKTIVSSAFLCGLLFPTADLQAVVVSTATPTNYETSTGAGGGWAYTGSFNNGSNPSGVYLGKFDGGYWVMTANHDGVGPGTNFTLEDNASNFISYNFVLGSYHAITHSGANVDLGIFKISPNPTFGYTKLDLLPNLTLGSTTITNSSTLTMIGFGRNQTTVGPNDFDYTTISGFSNGKRWGTNTMDSRETVDYDAPPFIGPIPTSYSNECIITDFDNQEGEAQASPGDSGGGVFYQNGSTLELAAIMVAADNNDSANYGNQTASIDVAAYHNEIFAIIPEPSTVWLALGGMGLLATFFTRKKSSLSSVR